MSGGVIFAKLRGSEKKSKALLGRGADDLGGVESVDGHRQLITQ